MVPLMAQLMFGHAMVGVAAIVPFEDSQHRHHRQRLPNR